MHVSIDRLVGLGLPLGDWALTGTGPLLLRGWLDDVGDLDVISRGSAWETAKRHGQVRTPADGSQLIEIDPVIVYRTWPYGEATVDEMIDTAEMVQGIPCVRLDHIVTYTQILDRPKDREHLSIIERHEQDDSLRPQPAVLSGELTRWVVSAPRFGVQRLAPATKVATM